MASFDTIRVLARRMHEEACEKAAGLRSASALLDGATALTGISRQAVNDDDIVLCGAEAILEPDTPAIFYKMGVPAEQAAFYQAHEFGHHFLDNETSACSAADIDESMPEEPIPLGVQRVEGYGPHERRECQANVFAREFLLPCDQARRLFSEERLPASEIAKRLGVPVSLVYQQLAQALLVPETDATAVPAKKMSTLDPSQIAAAEAEGAPYLIEAGPGTGKTRTLIARIEWLLCRKIDPASILALTFSNKAAEEIRERIALSAPEAASAIWVGTFHAFGLEVLRKYGHLQGLGASVQIIDPLLLLEQNLPSLPLNHYLDLYDPVLSLRDVLSAVSRAKEELVGPEEYRAFGEAMLEAAGSDPDAREMAQKAIEVADIYAVYEQILLDKGVVDFADLIVRPIRLLERHPELKEALCTQYKQILVDEYQDMNRASGVLLKLLAGNSKGLWVVGDARQSIYRFRGASPVNIRHFEQEFPGAQRHSLNINYRSKEPIVRLVEAFCPIMKASVGGLPAQWTANRGHSGGEVVMDIATDLSAEAAGLAVEIKRRQEQGIDYRNQAILCRTHTNLARFAAHLEAHGIPLLYLGDLFERPEIRDILALISFTCEPERGGLLRVAQFPEYNIPIGDVLAVLAFAKEQAVYPLDTLARLDDITQLTANGRDGLKRLSEHLSFVQLGTTPSTLLSEYLFTKGHYLDAILSNESVTSQQQRLALYQLLQFAVEHKPANRHNPCQQFLQWIRRVETYGEERQLRQLPSAAVGIDAVRLLTVHASKGLEFSVVYLPALGTTKFPVSPQYNSCPLPTGMLAEDPKASHAEEEECLFFVAMSRARDVLHLSRAERYGTASRASSFLTDLAPHLPRAPDGPASWHDSGLSESDEDILAHLAPSHDLHATEDLNQYLKCPRAYLYQRILDLSGARNDTAYVQFHRAVYAVLRWMRYLEAGTEATREDAMAKLDTSWEEIGPSDHPYATVYKEAANDIIERALSRRTRGAELLDADWIITRPGGQIMLRPDHVERGAAGPIVRRLRTGRPPKSKPDDDIYALYHHAAKQELDSARVEVLYLTTDHVVPVSMSDRVIDNRLEKYDRAIAGIRAGLFPAKPDDRICPRCPQYFICPGIPPKSSEN